MEQATLNAAFNYGWWKMICSFVDDSTILGMKKLDLIRMLFEAIEELESIGREDLSAFFEGLSENDLAAFANMSLKESGYLVVRGLTREEIQERITLIKAFVLGKVYSLELIGKHLGERKLNERLSQSRNKIVNTIPSIFLPELLRKHQANLAKLVGIIPDFKTEITPQGRF